MARPKLDPGIARTKVVAVRITEKGYDRVKSKADLKGMSVAEYVRHVLKLICDGSILVR